MTVYKQCSTSMAVKPMRAILEKLMRVSKDELAYAQSAKKVKPSTGGLTEIIGIPWKKKSGCQWQ